jgi:hypothetical protein
VHKRWTEVHQMYVEDGRRQSQPPLEAARSTEEEAETAANGGDLPKAIALYRELVEKSPGNELVRERLSELEAAHARATQIVTPAVAGAAAAHARTAAAAPTTTTSAPRAEDDWSDIAVTPVPRGGAVGAAAEAGAELEDAKATAPAMAPEDAPVGMLSLDVSVSVGPSIDAAHADDLPLLGGASSLPAAAPLDDVAFLQELLRRVESNRRPAPR